MNPQSDSYSAEPRDLGHSSSANFNGINFGEAEAKHRMLLVQWLASLFPSLNLPINTTDAELRACLIDGVLLCQILNKLRPGSVKVVSDFDHTLPSQSENVKRFLSALSGLGVPKFEISDLEKGHMKSVVDCLLTLRAKSLQNAWGDSASNSKVLRSIGNSPSNVGGQRKIPSESKFQSVLRSQVVAVKEYVRSFSRRRKLEEKSRAHYEPENTIQEPSVALLNHVGHKFHEVFPMKQGSYSDLPAAKISELMKSTSLDNAPTQSLLSVVNAILEESVERRNGEIPHRVACLLRKVVQEIERRISTQADHLRTQNNLFKAREDKYQSRIRVLEALASRTKEESEVLVPSQIRQLKTEETIKEEKKEYGSIQTEKTKAEEKRVDNQDVIRLMKELENKNMEISTMKQELETMKKKKEEKKDHGSIQTEKVKEEEKRVDNQDVIRLMKELDNKNMEISTMKQELDTMKKKYGVQCLQLEAEAKGAKGELNQKSQEYEDQLERLRNKVKESSKEYEDQLEKLRNRVNESSQVHENEHHLEISTLKQELETMKKTYGVQCLQLEAEAKGAKEELHQKSQQYEDQLERLRNKDKESSLEYEDQLERLRNKVKESSQEYENQLERLRNKIKESEAASESNYQKWNRKMNQMQKAMNSQSSSIQELKLSWESINQDVQNEQTVYAAEFKRLGVNLKPLVDAAENYQIILAENRKLFNEIQELKGNIRVYCRLRPFLPGQKEKQSIVEHLGETDLVVANPAKQGKEALKTFKFNKVFGPVSTQAEVYSDIQAFIRSVLDGYNVCIFAYGQTGSGKTYTMSGPNGATAESVGVNYRALDDLFRISTTRQSSIVYEIGVQIVEIYNEQVRDLLSVESTPKKLGILSHSQPNGLAVPDASMMPVKSTSDVIKLMDIGLKNRAKGSTAMNERSSRSHSVVSIHVRGFDKKSGSTLVGNLHLVDLAGSERIDRSEVTGDRLKEAQHINKSLSALGDVIFALAQKSAHVPYRNSKLTQLLQTSLGGQAKTLMLVQINSDIKSYSESLSTLKFAERVSGVELGAARSTKDGRDVRELMEQVASLRDTILTKDEEIERLQLLKDLKNVYPAATSEKSETTPD